MQSKRNLDRLVFAYKRSYENCNDGIITSSEHASNINELAYLARALGVFENYELLIYYFIAEKNNASGSFTPTVVKKRSRIKLDLE